MPGLWGECVTRGLRFATAATAVASRAPATTTTAAATVAISAAAAVSTASAEASAAAFAAFGVAGACSAQAFSPASACHEVLQSTRGASRAFPPPSLQPPSLMSRRRPFHRRSHVLHQPC